MNTQDNKLEYVKFLQEEYNRYYEHRTREYMEKLEKKSIAILTHMYDSVAHDFNRVSDYCNNGSTPLQGQQDEQPEAVNGTENAIEHDAIDRLTEYPPWSTETYDLCDSDEAIYDRNRKEIQSELFKDTPVKTEAVNGAENAIEHDVMDRLTEYPPWSTETYDLCDSDEAIYDRNRKEIQSELFKDTPVKTGDNKPCMDNIDTDNRDRAQITQSLSDRLGLGHNSLPGAQQIIVATRHTDQMTDIPDHLRWISLGEEIESISN